MDGPSVVQRLLQRVEHEAGVRRPRHAPADDAPGVGVDDEGDVDEARPGRDVGEVRDPQRVRPRRLELPVDVVERARRGLVADRGPAPACRGSTPCRAHCPHQPRHRAAGHLDALRAAAAARPCARRRPGSSPRTPAGSRRCSTASRLARAGSLRRIGAAGRHGRGRSTGRSAAPCRSARPRSRRGDRR